MLEKIIEDIAKLKPRKIAVQLPDGVRGKAEKILKELERTRADVIFLADSCWGACDLRDDEAFYVEADALIHFGHSSLGVKTKVPTFYVQYPSELDVMKAVEKCLDNIQENNIGLVTTIQHIDAMEKVRERLVRFGKSVHLGKSDSRAVHVGQVLGCDLGAATSIKNNVECFLFVGTGNFHPLGIALATGKRIYIADPEKNQARVLEEEREKFLHKRFAKIEKAKRAKRFGVILCLKKGQMREALARRLKTFLELKGKDAVVLAMNDITPEKLMGFRLDCYVSTACPRIAIDDADLFDKPMLTPQELEIALGEKAWEDYEMDLF